MKRMGSISIKSRLIILIGCVSLPLAGIVTFGLGGISKLNETVRAVYEDHTIALGQTDEIEALFLKNRIAIAVPLITPVPDFNKKMTEMEKNIKAIDKTGEYG